MDTKEDETVHVSSEKETSEKANKKEYIKLKKKIIMLKDNFNQFKRLSRMIYLKSSGILSNLSRNWVTSTPKR